MTEFRDDQNLPHSVSGSQLEGRYNSESVARGARPALGDPSNAKSRGGANLNFIAMSRSWSPSIAPIMRELMISHNEGSPTLKYPY
jgi:hypothetical protein